MKHHYPVLRHAAAGIRALLEHLGADLTRTHTYIVSGDADIARGRYHLDNCPNVAELSSAYTTQERTVGDALDALGNNHCRSCVRDQLDRICTDTRPDLLPVADIGTLEQLRDLYRNRSDLNQILGGDGDPEWVAATIWDIRDDIDVGHPDWSAAPGNIPGDVALWWREVADSILTDIQSVTVADIYQNTCRSWLTSLYQRQIREEMPGFDSGGVLVGVHGAHSTYGNIPRIIGGYQIGYADSSALLRIPAENGGWLIRQLTSDRDTDVSFVNWTQDTPPTEQQAQLICELAAGSTWQDAARIVTALSV
jgi:hypothetical protein